MHVVLESLDLASAERRLCIEALHHAGTIIDAASLLGITRHALKRRITKHNIVWPPSNSNMSLRPTPAPMDYEGTANMSINRGANAHGSNSHGSNTHGMVHAMMNPNLMAPNHSRMDARMNSDHQGLGMPHLGRNLRPAPQMNAANYHLGYPANNRDAQVDPNMGQNMGPNLGQNRGQNMAPSPSAMMPMEPADPHKYR